MQKKQSELLIAFYKKLKYLFLIKRYAIMEFSDKGDIKYISLHKQKGKWEALDNDIPDVINDLISSQNISQYKRKVYTTTAKTWKLYESDGKTISDYALRYCSLTTKQKASDLIERHKEFIKFKKKIDQKPKIIEYMS